MSSINRVFSYDVRSFTLLIKSSLFINVNPLIATWISNQLESDLDVGSKIVFI